MCIPSCAVTSTTIGFKPGFKGTLKGVPEVAAVLLIVTVAEPLLLPQVVGDDDVIKLTAAVAFTETVALE